MGVLSIFHAAPSTDVEPLEAVAAPTRADARAGGRPSARGGAAMAQTMTNATAASRVTRSGLTGKAFTVYDLYRRLRAEGAGTYSDFKDEKILLT